MSRLAQFFKGADSHFGIFEPRNHIVAVFPDLMSAQQGEKCVHNAGTPMGDAIAVSGEEVVQFAEEHLLRHGLWGVMMQKVSNFFATEEVYAERDLEMARHGAAFLAVRCPTQSAKRSIWLALAPSHPTIARYYSIGGVEHLTGETEQKTEPEKPLPPVPHAAH